VPNGLTDLSLTGSSDTTPSFAHVDVCSKKSGKPDEYSSGKHSGMGDSHNKRAGSTYIEISEMRERERKAKETRESADLDLK